MIRRWKVLSICLVAVFIMLSCNKDENRVIPYVPVSFTVDLNIWNDLTVPGNSVLFPGVGYAGVIVYCEFEGSYYAFDAACTNEISQSCILKIEGILATCPCCGSQFILTGGAYPSSGLASFPLQQYHVAVSGSRLHVYN